MKKVLIITYYWPPSGGAGVQRWLKFVKYMREFGWEPVVYTALNGEIPVRDDSLEKDVPKGITVIKRPIWEPYNLYKRFIGRKKDDRINAAFLNENKKTGLAEKISIWLRGNFFIPDARRFWIRPSIRFLNRYLAAENIGHVISSGPPHSMHLIALGLKRRRPELHWMADFRDPWTNIDFYPKLMLTPAADRKHHRLERQVLLAADRVLSIGAHLQDELKAIYRQAGGAQPEKFSVITNGFDTEDMLVMPEKDSTFSLAHIGTLVKDRNPEVLWKVLRQLVDRYPDLAGRLEIKLVGKVDLAVRERLEHYNLGAFVRNIAYLPHSEVVLEQARSRVLLLLVNQTKNARGILTGKVFEYIASGAPILAIGPVDGDLAQLLHSTGTGLISDFDDAAQLEKNLLDYFNGSALQPHAAEVQKYSRRELTRVLCTLLDQAG